MTRLGHPRTGARRALGVWPAPRAWLAAVVGLALAWGAAPVLAAGPILADNAAAPMAAAALLAEHAALAGAMRRSPFGEPVLLLPGTGDANHSGDVVMLLPRPLASVAGVFGSAAGLCSMLVMHLNVRKCSPLAGASGQVIDLSAGPMRQTLPGLVYSLRLTLVADATSADHFSAQFSGADSATGGTQLRVQVQAVAIDATSSWLHVRYSQTSTLTLQLASRLYLATAGRAKVGFSQAGVDADGRPRLVGGERGALERNVMRHYLALLVATAGTTTGIIPAARHDARLRAWWALTERHAAQLHEMSLADYLREKQPLSQAEPSDAR